MRKSLYVLAVVFTFFGFVNMKAETISKHDIVLTVEHLRQLAIQSQAQAAQAKSELGVVQSKADALAKDRDWWKNDDAAQKEALDKSEIARKKIAHTAHLLLLVASGLAFGFVFSLGSRFAAFIPLQLQPYAIALELAAGAMAFGFTWFTLSHL